MGIRAQAECRSALLDRAATRLRKRGMSALRTAPANPIVLIPSRLGATRLPGKPLLTIDPNGRYDSIVNVQGDLPVLDPETIRAPLRLLADPSVDIATPVALAA